MSKAACSAVLNYEESAWKCNEHERVMQGYATDEWDDEVVHTRYVDDVITMSPQYCERCLGEAIQKANSVPFDTASQGKKLEWLDMEVCTETQCVRLTPRKYETMPPWASDRRELRGYVLGRIARMKEATAQDDTEGYVRCCAQLITGLRQCGWMARDFKHTMYTTPCESTPPSSTIRTCFQAAVRGHKAWWGVRHT